MSKPKYSVFDDGSVLFRYDDPLQKTPFEVRIHCPLTSRLHNEHCELEERHRQWARGCRIPPGDESYQRYCDTRLDLLPAYQLYDLPLEGAIIHSTS